MSIIFLHLNLSSICGFFRPIHINRDFSGFSPQACGFAYGIFLKKMGFIFHGKSKTFLFILIVFNFLIFIHGLRVGLLACCRSMWYKCRPKQIGPFIYITVQAGSTRFKLQGRGNLYTKCTIAYQLCIPLLVRPSSGYMYLYHVSESIVNLITE